MSKSVPLVDDHVNTVWLLFTLLRTLFKHGTCLATGLLFSTFCNTDREQVSQIRKSQIKSHICTYSGQVLKELKPLDQHNSQTIGFSFKRISAKVACRDLSFYLFVGNQWQINRNHLLIPIQKTKSWLNSWSLNILHNLIAACFTLLYKLCVFYVFLDI